MRTDVRRRSDRGGLTSLTGVPGVAGNQCYFSSTEAPASSSCALIDSASSFAAPSLTAPGALSTRSFASLRPRPVIARTTLITWIFLSPAPVRTTSKESFSSSAAAPSPPAAGAAAAAIGTAAVTPHSSSIAFLSSTSSSTVIFPSESRTFFTSVAIVFLLFLIFSLIRCVRVFRCRIGCRGHRGIFRRSYFFRLGRRLVLPRSGGCLLRLFGGRLSSLDGRCFRDRPDDLALLFELRYAC